MDNYIVIKDDWFNTGRIAKFVERHLGSERLSRYEGLSQRGAGFKEALIQKLWDYDSNFEMAPTKFQDAPIGYKVKPISVGGKTFYV